MAGCGQHPPCLALPSQWKIAENGARDLKFPQFGITRTHILIKTIEKTSSHMLLSLTVFHTRSPEKGGDKLFPQTGASSHISKPGFKYTSGKLEQSAK